MASDVERDRAIVLLQDHYAKNRLEMEDFERRVEAVERAQTHAQIERAMEGLPVIAELVLASDAATTLKATLSSVSRRGRWVLPPRTVVKATLGSMELDLTEAELTRGETVLEVNATFGNVTLLIPDDLAVESEGSALLGSFEHMGQRARSKKDPRRVKIVGRALCGSVEIVVKKKPPPSLLEGIKQGVRGLLGG